MLMVKVKAPADRCDVLLEIAEKHDAKVIDDHIDSHMILEFTGKVEMLDDILVELKPFGIIEMTRTGPLGMRRGAKGFTV